MLICGLERIYLIQLSVWYLVDLVGCFLKRWAKITSSGPKPIRWYILKKRKINSIKHCNSFNLVVLLSMLCLCHVWLSTYVMFEQFTIRSLGALCFCFLYNKSPNIKITVGRCSLRKGATLARTVLLTYENAKSRVLVLLTRKSAHTLA